MTKSTLPFDDLPPVQPTSSDRTLQQKLEEVTGRRFYEACSGVIQALLMSCEWYMSINSSALTLVITCPDQVVNWRILNNVVPIATQLSQLSDQAKIRVCPPDDTATPFEIRVDEVSIYKDSP